MMQIVMSKCAKIFFWSLLGFIVLQVSANELGLSSSSGSRSATSNSVPQSLTSFINHDSSAEIPRSMASNTNFYALSSVQRRRHTIRYQLPKGTKNSSSLESSRRDKITIPIGVSHYKPIQFVDSLKPFKQLEFTRVPFFTGFNNRNNQNGDNNSSSTQKSNEKRQVQSSLSKPVNQSETEDSFESNAGFRTESGFVHKPRMIELESSYIPLTLRFSTRPRKLNIISHDNDLIGQDSNRHDRINGKTEPIDIVDRNSGIFNLDTRTIFGPTRREEPLILKRGQNSKIPPNMQSIIKCVFPDFQFDGVEKVRSAC